MLMCEQKQLFFRDDFVYICLPLLFMKYWILERNQLQTTIKYLCACLQNVLFTLSSCTLLCLSNVFPPNVTQTAKLQCNKDTKSNSSWSAPQGYRDAFVNGSSVL